MTGSTQTQIRRGTSSQCDALTPALGEMIYDTTNKRQRSGDGSKVGGYPQASAVDVQSQNFTYASAVTLTGSSPNAIVLTVQNPPSAYVAGMEFEFKAPATTTGAFTVDAGAGAVAVDKVSSGALVAGGAGDVANGCIYRVVHNGTVWQLSAGGGGLGAVTGSGGVTSSGGNTPNIAIDTNNALGVGSYCLAGPTGLSVVSVASGATIAAGTLQALGLNVINGVNGAASASRSNTLSGTWRNMSGLTVSGGATSFGFGLFMRIA